MSELINPKIDVLSLSLDGFEGPIDLLLSLARDHKIDLTKLSILKLAEQYLEFLDHAIKKDIDIAAEYLVMGAWLAFLKSKLFTIILSAQPRTYLNTKYLNIFCDQPSGAELDLTIIFTPNNLHKRVQ